MEIIRKGDIIDTVDGYITITSRGNGARTAYGIYTTIDEDGNETKDAEMLFTASDLAGYMREYDGRNHKVIIED